MDCPKKYEFAYILKPPVERDKRSSLFGSIIGILFEWFYSKNVWSSPDPTRSLLDLSEKAIEHVLAKEKFSEHEDMDLMSRIRNDLHEYVPLGIEIIRNKQLLTPYSRAEVDLTVTYSSVEYGLTLKIGGRADFIHSVNNRDFWILDGKASAHKDKYIDAEQVIWYGVQHYIKYGVAPSQVGFLFYRFPDDPVKWVSLTEDSFRNSIRSTFEVAKKISLKVFPATPGDSACKFCDYQTLCPEGMAFSAEKMIADGRRFTESIFDLEQF